MYVMLQKIDKHFGHKNEIQPVRQEQYYNIIVQEERNTHILSGVLITSAQLN